MNHDTLNQQIELYLADRRKPGEVATEDDLRNLRTLLRMLDLLKFEREDETAMTPLEWKVWNRDQHNPFVFKLIPKWDDKLPREEKEAILRNLRRNAVRAVKELDEHLMMLVG